MDKLGTCGVCKFYNAKVYLAGDESEGKCFVLGQIRWVNSRDTCGKLVENTEYVRQGLLQKLTDVRGHLRSLGGNVEACKSRIAEDRELIGCANTMEQEVLAQLKERGVPDPEEDDPEEDGSGFGAGGVDEGGG